MGNAASYPRRCALKISSTLGMCEHEDGQRVPKSQSLLGVGRTEGKFLMGTQSSNPS